MFLCSTLTTTVQSHNMAPVLQFDMERTKLHATVGKTLQVTWFNKTKLN